MYSIDQWLKILNDLTEGSDFEARFNGNKGGVSIFEKYRSTTSCYCVSKTYSICWLCRK